MVSEVDDAGGRHALWFPRCLALWRCKALSPAAGRHHDRIVTYEALHLTGAARLVPRDIKPLQAAPAGELSRSALGGVLVSLTGAWHIRLAVAVGRPRRPIPSRPPGVIARRDAQPGTVVPIRPGARHKRDRGPPGPSGPPGSPASAG